MPVAIVVIPAGMLSDSSDSQPLKAKLPIDVTSSGIFTSFSASQPENVLSAIAVTPDGIFTDSSDSQPRKAELPIDVAPSGIFISFSDLQWKNV